ncbi:hypothetical protein D3C81_1804790 [compost metagenome]
MPDITATPRQIIAMLTALLIEYAQFDALGMRRKKGEINAMAVIRCTMGGGIAGCQLCHHPSRISQIVARGGNVRLSECWRPWLAISSLCTAPPLPVLLPW